MTFRGAAASFALVSLLAAACGGSSGGATVGPTQVAVPTTAPTTAPAAAPTASPDLAHPVGMFAIGHSGLTGEGTAAQDEPAYDNSWATGTSVDVHSIYLRLAAVRPEFQGHVENTAQGGAKASALVAQATSALSRMPVPAFVMISTVDNDIRCDGNDLDRIPKFGQDVAAALELIVKASPNVQILVVGPFGRPTTAFFKAVVAKDPGAISGFQGTGICDFFDPDGKIVQAHFDTLSALTDAFENEETRVCALVPQCSTDGGVRKAWIDHLEYFSPDWNHLNVLGQAAEAEQMWPVAQKVLGL